MENEEQHETRFIHVSGLQSIKTKIIVFALLAVALYLPGTGGELVYDDRVQEVLYRFGHGCLERTEDDRLVLTEQGRERARTALRG